jgi:predicted enzyme related to lactoylglutathione lyase
MSGEPSHVELGVPDVEKARRFWGELFDWKFDQTRNGAAVETGGIAAGLHADPEGPEVLAFFAVDDLDAAAKRIVELGGTVGEGGDESASGRYLYFCRDDQGVPFGLHQRPA